MTDSDFGIAVFPFLKTRSPVTLGGLVFQATDNFADLTSQQSEAVSEIANLLFLNDDVRVRSASFAIVRNIDIHEPSSPNLVLLQRIQNVVSYFYNSLHSNLRRRISFTRAC
jgi:hypothetical protein